MFEHLFSPFKIRDLEIRNRIFSTGHDTDLGHDGLPTDALIAYQRARAKGGAGLIVVQVVAVHETARYTAEVLMGTSDDCIPEFKKLFDAIHAEGTKAFVQLFHPGRELLARDEGAVQVAISPSSSPTERFRIIPREMTEDEITEIIDGYGAAARRMAEAGADGVEVVASHGYLPAQFLSEHVNQRADKYGGSFENRLRFLKEASASVRTQAPENLILGLRISGNEYDMAAMDEDETFTACRDLKEYFDYFNVIAGTSASSSGAVHIVPPMSVETGYTSPFAQRLKQVIGKPVFVAGRINQPQVAEQVLQSGSADMCGMTRAMICDPEMPNKARAEKPDDIRACIGCNQACIGHAQLGVSISCLQHPETGRELRYGAREVTDTPRKVVVVGGGPAGMKAAAVAAEMGHDVALHERSSRLGGQVQLAQLLPHRAEFGGLITNLTREMELADVEVCLNSEMSAEKLSQLAPDLVVLATGSSLKPPPIEGGEGVQIVHAEEVLSDAAETGNRVVVYDWLADWTGVGIAEKLATEGAYVRYAVNGVCPAAAIQNYVRDAAIARLYKLGIEMEPFMRLFGADDGVAYFVHTPSQETKIYEDVDTIVLACPNEPYDPISRGLAGSGIAHVTIGDAAAPRTAEEAVVDGLKLTINALGRLEQN